MSEIDEIGADLDRVLRTTLMLVGQVIERRARLSSTQSRARVDEQRRALLDGQGAARKLFLPLTLDARAAERAAPAVLAGGLQAARDWAAVDPVASVAADHLSKEWERLYPGRSAREVAAAANLNPAAPTPLGVEEAKALAAEHAPSYYNPAGVSDAQLVEDWSHWAQEGHLPQESVRRHYATHLHRDGEVTAAGDEAVAALEAAATEPPGEEDLAAARAAAEGEALETIWHASSAVDEARALDLAGRFAPVYYSPGSTDELLEDWRYFVQEGELPARTRHESWARWSGQLDRLEGLVDEPRAHELALIWDEGRAERGALEYAAAVVGIETVADDVAEENPRQAEALTRAAEDLAQNLPTPTEVAGDREHAAAVFRPMLDPEKFNEVSAGEAGRAWLAAHVWSSADAEAAAAADQLARQYQVRFGKSASAGMGLDASSVTPERVIELTEQAHEFYTNRYDGSPAQEYLHSRFGASVDRDAGVSLGYAPKGRELTAHLLEAGATPEELVDAGLSRVGRNGEPYDLFRDRVMIAVRNGEGRVVGFTGRDLSGAERAPKYLNTPATAAFDKSSVVLGLTEARGSGARVVRVEGGLDVVAVNLAGEGKVAGASTMGTSLSDAQAEALAAAATDGVLMSSLDNDEAGHKGREREIAALAAHGVSVRSLPITESDPAEQWESNPDRLREAVSSSPTVLLPAGVDLIGRDLDRASWEHAEDRVRALATAARHVEAAPAQDQETLFRVLTQEYHQSYNRNHAARPLTAQEAAESAATAVRAGSQQPPSPTAWTDAVADLVADLSTAAYESSSSPGWSGDAVSGDRETNEDVQRFLYSGSAYQRFTDLAREQGYDNFSRDNGPDEAMVFADGLAKFKEAEARGEDPVVELLWTRDGLLRSAEVYPAYGAKAVSAPLEAYDRAAATVPEENSSEITSIRQRAAAGFSRSTVAGVEAAAGKPVRTPKPKGRTSATTAGREDTLGM